MTAAVAFDIGKNQPRVLAEGDPLPAELDQAGGAVAADPLAGAATPAPYWTGEKVATMVARACKSLASAFGEDMKAEEWELEMIEVSPTASLLNDLLPGVANSGENLSTPAKVFVVLLVFGLLALLRLPTILTVHRGRQYQAALAAQQQPQGEEPPAAAAEAPAPARPVGRELFQGGTVGSGRLGQR